jgi:hypothetical protein
LLDTAAFQSLAEFAIALAGFVGVVIVFRRGEDRLHPADDIRVFIALLSSLAGAFLALLPVSLNLFALAPATSFIFSSAMYAAVVLSLLLLVATRIGRLAPDSRAVLSRPLTLFFYTLLGSSVAANLLNVVSFFGEPSGGVYFIGIVALLANCATVFARIVFIRPSA